MKQSSMCNVHRGQSASTRIFWVQKFLTCSRLPLSALHAKIFIFVGSLSEQMFFQRGSRVFLSKDSPSIVFFCCLKTQQPLLNVYNPLASNSQICESLVSSGGIKSLRISEPIQGGNKLQIIPVFHLLVLWSIRLDTPTRFINASSSGLYCTK